MPALLRRKKLAISFIVLMLLYVSCSPQGQEFSDDFRFRALELRCLDAKEFIHRKLRTREIDLEDYPWAKIVNETYAPHFMLVQLLIEPQVVAKINKRYENTVDSGPCRGHFVNVIHSLSNLPKAMLCTDQTPSSAIPASPVTVKFEYGSLEKDIRPFRMLLVDNQSGEVIAEQRSFELLLGNLRGKRRAWYGMGGSQVARACQLTSPRQFIQSVVQ